MFYESTVAERHLLGYAVKEPPRTHRCRAGVDTAMLIRLAEAALGDMVLALNEGSEPGPYRSCWGYPRDVLSIVPSQMSPVQ